MHEPFLALLRKYYVKSHVLYVRDAMNVNLDSNSWRSNLKSPFKDSKAHCRFGWTMPFVFFWNGRVTIKIAFQLCTDSEFTSYLVSPGETTHRILYCGYSKRILWCDSGPTILPKIIQNKHDAMRLFLHEVT